MPMIPEEREIQMNEIKRRIKEITKDMGPLEKRAFYCSLYIQLKEAMEKKEGETDA